MQGEYAFLFENKNIKIAPHTSDLKINKNLLISYTVSLSYIYKKSLSKNTLSFPDHHEVDGCDEDDNEVDDERRKVAAMTTNTLSLMLSDI